jgi:hypothetical protein
MSSKGCKFAADFQKVFFLEFKSLKILSLRNRKSIILHAICQKYRHYRAR